MQCPKCGYALSPFDKECPRCARMVAAPAAPVAPSAQDQGAACPGCGRIVSPQDAFCPGCGAVLSGAKQAVAKAAAGPPAQVEPHPATRAPVAPTPPTHSAGQATEMTFCRNCGAAVPPGAVVCLSCGVAPTNGNNYCQNCAVQTDPRAEICTSCGVRLARGAHAGAKSKLAAGLLGIFLGSLGVHRFYLGYNTLGVVMLVVNVVGGMMTMGVASLGVAIWGLVEGIMILVGSISVDADGNPLRE